MQHRKLCTQFRPTQLREGEGGRKEGGREGGRKGRREGELDKAHSSWYACTHIILYIPARVSQLVLPKDLWLQKTWQGSGELSLWNQPGRPSPRGGSSSLWARSHWDSDRALAPPPAPVVCSTWWHLQRRRCSHRTVKWPAHNKQYYVTVICLVFVVIKWLWQQIGWTW